MLKKINLIKFFSLILLSLLVIRIYYISCVKGDGYIEKAKKQNYFSVKLDVGRSNILDRNGKLITGVEKKQHIIAFPFKNKIENFELAELISKYVDENKYEIYSSLYNNQPMILEVTSSEDMTSLHKFRNVTVTELSSRYMSDSPAAALIGYMSGNDGVSGLEFVYDDILKNGIISNASIFSDINNNLYGDIKISENDTGSGVKTTIDLEFQRICDNTLKKFNFPSAAVLMDIDNFQILAMSSYPTFNQNDISSYLNRSDGALNNRCLQNYDIGSVFKIIVTAAALENGYSETDKNYNCNGSVNVYNQSFECHNLHGHGTQNMYEAFMNSCNPAFIDIGSRIGYTKILDMAEKFGFENKILFPDKLGYLPARLPDKNNYFMSDLANVSIGQGKISCNAVQGALLSAVIANGGIFGYADCVLGVVDSNGTLLTDTTNNFRKRIISKNTANIIRDMMRQTCINGTGTTGQLDFFGSGGKTGSAQTGWLVDGEFYQHAWFTGFFPSDDPEYSLCVLVENGRSGSEVAAPIFKEIGEKIMKMNK